MKIDHPLDFTAVTDHAEYLGEVEVCTTEGSPTYGSQACQVLRAGGVGAYMLASATITRVPPVRYSSICGDDNALCENAATTQWAKMQEATEAAYDRSSACSFTALHGYEHTGTPGTSNYHRNVIFRNSTVPSYATSYVEAPSDEQLWAKLHEDCLDNESGCDVLAIPHNSNLSNGRMFSPAHKKPLDRKGEIARAQDNQRIEPLIEIFQHKGNSECINGLSGILGAPDELCNVEQVRFPGTERKISLMNPATTPPTPFEIDAPVTDCNDEGAVAGGGMVNGGCVSNNDFVRGLLLTGLQEKQRLGVNPYRYGIIASTDTHMSTPGAANEAGWQGHVLEEVASFERRLGGGLLPSNLLGNPGGLAGVWAIENSRDAIFEALKRRETFGTTGPRILPRFFGGWAYATEMCADADMIDKAYNAGTPMGGDLPATETEAAAPTFLAAATRDPAQGANKLQRLQIVKGWISEDGSPAFKVYDVEGSIEQGGTIDPETGDKADGGANAMCTVFTDPDFNADLPSYYYLRVVENPSLRWSQAQCLALPQAERPVLCDNDAPKVIHEMAWTSPIWYQPAD